MQAYAPRPIRSLGLHESDGWRVKQYAIVHGDRAFDEDGFEPAIGMALASLPEPALGRPGLAFLIAHQGATGDYVVLCWWDHENELPMRIWVRRTGEAWRPAQEGESVCVWDLEVIWSERNAWVETMLRDEGPNAKAWLERWAGERPT